MIESKDIAALKGAISQIYPNRVERIRSILWEGEQFIVIANDEQKYLRFTFSPDFKTCKTQLLSDSSTRVDDAGKSKPCPGGYRIPLSKKCRSSDDDKKLMGLAGEKLVGWGVAKAAGAAVGEIARSHGLDPVVPTILAEGVTQALVSTLFEGKRTGFRKDLALTFIANAAGSISAKAVSAGLKYSDIDDAILGADAHVQMVSAAAGGIGTGATVSSTLKGILTKGNQVLRRISEGGDRVQRSLHSDAFVRHDRRFVLTKADHEALFDLAIIALVFQGQKKDSSKLTDWLSNRSIHVFSDTKGLKQDSLAQWLESRTRKGGDNA
jgi:hypothetical protein